MQESHSDTNGAGVAKPLKANINSPHPSITTSLDERVFKQLKFAERKKKAR
jgi:hypothetical protein